MLECVCTVWIYFTKKSKHIHTFNYDNCLTPCFSTWTPQICYTYLWNDACTLIGFERSDRSRVFRTVHCELVKVTATCTDICITLLSYAYDNKKHYWWRTHRVIEYMKHISRASTFDKLSRILKKFPQFYIFLLVKYNRTFTNVIWVM